MERILLFICISVLSVDTSAQNVFNYLDAQVRHDKTKPLGSSENPDPAKAGVQKWVSTPTTGVSTGSTAFNTTSFKAYFINVNGARMAFRIKFPYTYAKPEGVGKKYPVMLSLHGAGEAGCPTNGGIYNNEQPLWSGGSLFMERVDNNQFDGFLVYPQLVNATTCWGVWGSTPISNITAVFAMIDSLGKYARADMDRILVGGLSGGGFGAWRLASSYPQRIAKILPSAAAGSTTNRAAFVHIPIWFASGELDMNPSPSQALYAYTRMKEIGADIKYTGYPDQLHAMWYSHWRETDFVAAMNDAHKSNPLVFFQRNEFCQNEAIDSKLGITAGFHSYEWEKDGVIIATNINGINNILNAASVISFTGNEITIRSFGSYRVRFRRTASAPWSDWSPHPAIIKVKAITQAPMITISGTKSKVLPSLDGNTTVPLQMPAGFINYNWIRVSDNVKVGSGQIFNAPPGVYKAKYEERTGCGPTYSPEFTAINANGTPKPDPATNLTVTPLLQTAVKLAWNQHANETGFEVYRGVIKGGPYQLLTLIPVDVSSYQDNSLAPNTTYFYVVRAINGTGAAVKSNEASPNNGNAPPVISSIPDIYVKTDSTIIRNFTVSDNIADIVTVTIPRKPSFIALQKLNATSYRITAKPTIDNLGWTQIIVEALDNKGMFTTKTFSVYVTNKHTRSVFLNFGNVGKTAGAPWNNWLGVRTANSTILNLKDEKNIITTIDVTTVSGWLTTTVLGHITGNNDGVVPDAVLQSGIADNGTARQIRISGLSTLKRYNLVFIGSQNEGIIATTQYSTGTQKPVLDARYNNQQTANLNSLVPDATGQILVSATRISGAPYSYLNGMIIEEYSPSIMLLNPENLYVEPVDKTSVSLSWSDKTNNESLTGGYELQRASDSLFTQGVIIISLPANTTKYKNTGLLANKKYWYRVRAKNGTNYSAYSNRVSTITPSSIIYVNFNTTVANGPYPWNNILTAPLAPFTSVNLKTESGLITTVKLSLETVFNGEFAAGMSTGNNSGVVPDNVLRSAYWLDNRQVSQFRVTGLNRANRYRFGFFGSAGSSAWFKGDYTASYTINGRSVYLNSWQNTSRIVYIGDVVPDANGEVLLNFSTTTTAAWGFNGGIVIHDYADAQGGTVMNSTLENDLSDSGRVERQLTKVVVYPNPFNDKIFIDLYNSSVNNKISVELFDIHGRVMSKRIYSNLHAGPNKLIYESNEPHAKGIFLLSLKINGKQVQAVKLVRN